MYMSEEQIEVYEQLILALEIKELQQYFMNFYSEKDTIEFVAFFSG